MIWYLQEEFYRKVNALNKVGSVEAVYIRFPIGRTGYEDLTQWHEDPSDSVFEIHPIVLKFVPIHI